VSQSTTPQSHNRAVLFQRDGELSEFADLLSELAIPVHECTSGLPEPSELEGARLVVISGRRLLESGTPNLRRWPRTIAVVDDASKTLVTHLGRIGAAMVIRRPIHPHALRLLLLHEIYAGPERRNRKRVLVGHAIRVVSGLSRPHALLLELSPTGARIELANAPKVGSKIRILLGKDLTKAKPVKLQAKVIRSIGASGKKSRSESEIGVVLLDAQHHAKTIKGILDRFALSPAKWKTTTPANQLEARRRTNPLAKSDNIEASRCLPPTRSPLLQAEVDSEVVETESRLPTSFAEGVSAQATAPDDKEFVEVDDECATTQLESPSDSRERRCEARIPYAERVVALGEEAARVIVGRDLSSGGMRIAATPSVAIGDILRVALHSGTQTEPLVVLAHALRDDGEDGLILSFDDLSESQREQLDMILSSGLPVHASSDDLDDSAKFGESIIVAEMLETLAPESDAEIAAHLDSVFDTSTTVEDAR
jgi:hypothetical protein